MNRHTFCGAWFCLTAAWMAGGSSIVFGQVMLQVNGAMLRQAAGPAFLPPEGDGVAIGDPWWDDAAPEPKAGDPDAAPAAPADENPQGNREDQGEAEMMRMSVRQSCLAILRRELSIVRQTCPSLERQQRAIVLEAGRTAVEKAVEDQVTAAFGRRPGRPADIEAAIGEALQKSLAANAADGEAAAYEAERGLRKERAKQATIAALVADVDRDAFLDDAERAALAKTLSESYRVRWGAALGVLLNGGPAISGPPPQGLDRCVEKALGAERKAEWLARREEAGKLFAQAEGQFQPMQQLGRPAGVRVLWGGGVRGQLMILQGGVQAGPPAVEEVPVEGDK